MYLCNILIAYRADFTNTIDLVDTFSFNKENFVFFNTARDLNVNSNV